MMTARGRHHTASGLNNSSVFGRHLAGREYYDDITLDENYDQRERQRDCDDDGREEDDYPIDDTLCEAYH